VFVLNAGKSLFIIIKLNAPYVMNVGRKKKRRESVWLLKTLETKEKVATNRGILNIDKEIIKQIFYL
jgi:hypothetical protein